MPPGVGPGDLVAVLIDLISLDPVRLLCSPASQFEPSRSPVDYVCKIVISRERRPSPARTHNAPIRACCCMTLWASPPFVQPCHLNPSAETETLSGQELTCRQFDYGWNVGALFCSGYGLLSRCDHLRQGGRPAHQISTPATLLHHAAPWVCPSRLDRI